MAEIFSEKRLAITVAGLFMFLFILPSSRIVMASSHTTTDTIDQTTLTDTISDSDISSETAETIYHAALGLQTAEHPHIARFGYYTKNPGGIYCPYGEENWNKLTHNYIEETDSKNSIKNKKKEPAKPRNHLKPKLHPAKNSEAKQKITVPGEFTDVELKGNGVYTVSLEHADFQNETTLSLLQLTTDIPSDAEIQISDIHLIINKREIVSFDEAFLEDDETYLSGGMVVLLLSHRQYGLKGRLSRLGHPEDTPDGWKLLRGGKDESISITFTVSGFDYDNEDAQPKSDKKNPDLRKIIGSDSPDNPAKENERGGISIVAVVGVVLVIIAALITGIVIRKREDHKTGSKI